MKGFFESVAGEGTREPDASELERTLWMRSLLGGDMPPGSSDTLAQRIRENFFAKGQRLYRQGDAADRIFFIVRGTVALLHLGIKTREFGPRDVLGLIDALQNRPHAFDALVREDAVVLELEFDDWLEFLEDSFEFTRAIILRLASSLPPTSPPGRDLSRPTAQLRARRDESSQHSRDSYRSSLGPRLSLSFVERLAVLRACPPLAGSGIEALSRLARFAELVFLEEEERQMLIPPNLYVVESGRLRTVASDDKGNTWTEDMGPSGALGGLGVIQPGLYDVEVTALEPSSLFRIPTERLFDVMEDHFPLALSFFAHISGEAEAQALERKRASDASASSRLSRPSGSEQPNAPES